MQMIKSLAYSLFYGYRNVRNHFRIWRYKRSSPHPWSYGYAEYRWNFTDKLLRSPENLDAFAAGQSLPDGFGIGLDERVIEYPWLFQRLRHLNGSYLLDAGSILNHKPILGHPIMQNRQVIIYTLAPEGTISKGNVSYIYGDLRNTILRDSQFDEIVCISTLEHVGMDNTALYTKETEYKENRTTDYLAVIAEFRRLLKSGGKLFLTVPFGHYENHGWLQQFDPIMISQILDTFGGQSSEISYYRYYSDHGWKIVTQLEAETASYNNVHNASSYQKNDIAAAEAIACIELQK